MSNIVKCYSCGSLLAHIATNIHVMKLTNKNFDEMSLAGWVDIMNVKRVCCRMRCMQAMQQDLPADYSEAIANNKLEFSKNNRHI